ncbi:MAG: ABC transporter permease, partial [Candidatus Acidoferrales bacterium]
SRGLTEDEADQFAQRQIRDWEGFASDIRRADRPHTHPRLDQWSEKAEEVARRRGGWWLMFADLQRDVLYGLRMLAKNPGFTTVAVLTLALGIGANTAIFSAVHAVLLRPFPYPDPERLAMVYSLLGGGTIFWTSDQNVQDLRDQSTLFEGFGAMDYRSVTLLGGEEPERLAVGLVSANVFPLLKVQTAAGRFFTPEEELPEGPGVVILSHSLWQRRFGGDPRIVDQLLEFDGDDPVRVVGVMPRGFRLLVPRHTNFPRKIDLWHPYQIDYRNPSRFNNIVTVLGRLKEGVTWPQAQQELDQIAKRIEEQHYTPKGRKFGWRAFPLHGDTVQEIRPSLLVLLAAAGFVLLIACANVANLLLAHGATRQKELAIRTALGATRARLIRQSLTESTLLALVGGGAGVFLAWAGVRALSSFLPAKLPRLETIELDATVLGGSLALSLLAGIFFGVVPALHSARGDVDAALKEGGRGRSGGALPNLLRSALIVGEIALSLMLLVGGSLMVRSFLKLQKVNPGYNASNTLTFTIALPSARYKSGEEKTAFFRLLQERIAGLPGVESVGGNMLLPFGRSLWWSGFTFYDPSTGPPGEPLVSSALLRPTLPGYFQTLQTRLVAGRFFSHQDAQGSELVAIIDETLAQTVWPGENPIGKRLSRGGNPEKPEYRKVVGVVENLRLTRLSGERMKQVYLPFSQFTPSTLSYVVRTGVEPLSLLQPIRAEVRALDPNLPLWEIGQLDHTLAEVMAPQRLTSLLMGLFAALGLTLAAVGVYGVISYSVNQRTHEIGIRIALGAQRSDIYKIIIGQGLRLAALGIALGLAGAMALARTIESLLYGVSSLDPWSYTLVSAVLAGAAMLACYIPARRAARVDPMVALRYE